MKRPLTTMLALAWLGCAGSNDTPPPVQPAVPQPAVLPTGTGNPPATPGIPPLDPSDPLAQQMQLRATQFAANMVPATPLFRGTLATGSNQDFQAVMQAGRCFKILAVGGGTVTDLDLFLFDPNGAQVQQDTATDAYPVLGLTQPICPETPGAYRVQVRMYAGTGDFGVQVYQTQQ